MIKTISTCYTTCENLVEFIKVNNYLLKEEILVQVFFCGKDIKLFEIILKTIKEYLPKVKIAGISCESNIYNGKSLQGETVISFTNFEKTKVEVKMASLLNNENEYNAGRKLAQQIVQPNTKVLLLYTGSPLIDSESLLEGIDSVKENIIIVGGSAFTFDSNKDSNIFICANDKIGDSSSFVLVALSGDELIANCEYMFNWLSIGHSHEITKTTKNRIIEIEGQPARSYYEELIGEKLSENKITSVLYTLVSEEEGVQYSHPIYEIKDSTELGTYGQIRPGTKVRLAYGNRYNIFEQTKKQMEKVALMPAESIMIYSCASRWALLKGSIDFDVLAIRKALSINGLYADGEFSNNANGKNVCVKHSASLLVLSEDTSSRIELSLKDINVNDYFNKEEIILHRFLHKAVDDLEKLNNVLEKAVESKTAEINHHVHHNKLTELCNNFSLIEDADTRRITKLAFIEFKFMRDFERFYGSVFSQKVQISIARALENEVRGANVFIYQVRSDTFAIGSNNKKSKKFFLALIKNVQKDFTNNTFNIDNVKLHCYNKIGIAMETEPLRDRAFLALQLTRDTGRSIVVYSQNLSNYEKSKENLLLIDEIQEAIDDNRIVAYYQPVLNNENGKIFSYECLMRMIRKDGSVVLPGVFLETAKKSGLYSELTKRMVGITFTKFKNLDKCFSINLDILDMYNEETMDFIYEAIKVFPEPKRIIIEILESADIEAEKFSFEILRKLKSYGVTLAIDDFGSGYSNIKYLVLFDIDIIKIDGSIVKNIAKSSQDRKVVAAIKDMASASKMKVVAEYIENEEIQKNVLEIGIEYSQGFYIGKPNLELLVE